jgi:hypothetical protein
VRNTIGDGISMPGEGYEMMAETRSTGAVENTLRRFTDDTITSPNIDYATSLYFVQLVVCPITEPYAIQIAIGSSPATDGRRRRSLRGRSSHGGRSRPFPAR